MTINIGFDFDETLHFNYRPSSLLKLFKLYYLNNCKMFIITKNQHWAAKAYDPNLIRQDLKTIKNYNQSNKKAPISKIHLWLEHYCNIPGIASNCTVIAVPYTSSKGRVIYDNKIQAFFDDYDAFLLAIVRYLQKKNYNKIMLYKISERKRDDGKIEKVYYNGHENLARQEKRRISPSYKNLIPPASFFAK